MDIPYNYYLVGLSYIIAVFGSYTSLQLAIHIPKAQGAALWGWLGSAALALGGGAIWSMHFIGMLAYDIPISVHYDLLLTISSLILAVCAAGLGLFLVGRGESSIIKLILAGIAGGISVAGMHYLGMMAMTMPADINYDPTLVIVSVVIAITAATVALWLAFNLRGKIQRFGSAFVMGIAVCGMHYTGMSGVTMTPNGDEELRASFFAPEILALIVFATACIFLGIFLFATLFETLDNDTRELELQVE